MEFRRVLFRSPRIAENEESRREESFRQIIGQSSLFSFGGEVEDRFVFRKQFVPVAVVFEHFFLGSQLGVAETRVGIIGETDVHVEHYHVRSEEHTSELQSRQYLVCRLLLEKKKIK